MNHKTKRISNYGLLIALAFIFSYLESLIPVSGPVPGIKLGLANVVVMITLYKLGAKEAFAMAIVRVILVGLTFSNVSMMMYSLAGSLLSCITMILLKRTKKFSMVGVSVLGGVMHNVGQIIMAIIVLGTIQLYYYLPVLIISGIVAGVLIGILGTQIIKHLPKEIA